MSTDRNSSAAEPRMSEDGRGSLTQRLVRRMFAARMENDPMDVPVEWRLREHGDSRERAWAEHVLRHFPLYESFWALHIVPFTFRAELPACVAMRPDAPRFVQDLATASYSAFVSVAACHGMLQDDKASPEGWIPQFYDQVYSLDSAVERFLRSVKNFLEQLDVSVVSDKGRRLAQYGDSVLSTDIKRILRDRPQAYRNIHHGPSLVIGEHIPVPGAVSEFQNVGVTALVAARLSSEAFDHSASYVLAREQAAGDLAQAEKVLDRVWAVVLREYQALAAHPDYRALQLRITPRDRDTLSMIKNPPSQSLVLRFA